MSNSLYQDLAWLPRAPADFSARCKALAQSDAPIGRPLRALAGFALDENQLTRLSKLITPARIAAGMLAPLAPLRLGLISNATTDFLVPALVATFARHGFALECVAHEFGQPMQTALDPAAAMYARGVELVLFALDFRGLPLVAVQGDRGLAEASVSEALAQIDAMREAVRRYAGVPTILQSLARPPETVFGSFDAVLPGTLRGLIDAFNRALAVRAADSSDLFFDVAGLAETVGLADWHDAALWNMGKIPFANVFLPLYADHVARIVAAWRGKSRRCLILDLDNTVWGGVIGDDGLEGIAIAQGDAQGEAHLTVQRTALVLRERGIVLAVSSKNEDAVARLPFQKHPEMLLREDHLAVFQANWNDKATNIKAIAESLALGLESMVFLDDNPVERGLVRQILPEVAIPELPEDAALYARTLLASGFFEAVTFSLEDAKRAELYQDNAKRLALKEAAGDVAGYLRSLAMTISFAPFDATGRARIAQLINKSNQFNLTTRRLNEVDVAALEADRRYFTRQIRLRDAFGDNGMISVIVCEDQGADWEIHTWLMSCRVLMRGVEEAVLNDMVAAARRAGATRLIGRYVPTERNQMVADHYPKLGFTLQARADSGETVWSLELASYVMRPVEMAIETVELEET